MDDRGSERETTSCATITYGVDLERTGVDTRLDGELGGLGEVLTLLGGPVGSIDGLDLPGGVGTRKKQTACEGVKRRKMSWLLRLMHTSNILPRNKKIVDQLSNWLKNTTYPPQSVKGTGTATATAAAMTTRRRTLFI